MALCECHDCYCQGTPKRGTPSKGTSKEMPHQLIWSLNLAIKTMSPMASLPSLFKNQQDICVYKMFTRVWMEVVKKRFLILTVGKYCRNIDSSVNTGL